LKQVILFGVDDFSMKDSIEDRARLIGVYIVENSCTVRRAAQKFGVSKSTVHKDITERLQKSDRALYNQVRKILDINKAERHMRGGIATRRKFKGE